MTADSRALSPLPLELVDTLISLEQRHETCWRVTRVLGSMLAFDFGGKVSVKLRRDGMIDIGSSLLSIRNAHWKATNRHGDIVDSDALDDTAMPRLRRAFTGCVLQGCDRLDDAVRFRFSEQTALTLDLTNRYEVEDDEEIAELTLMGGAVLLLWRDGSFTLDGAESERRRSAEAA